jgi:ribulose-5-phosphate 4-epimerase/fuculose-1-phosphate aldolase
MITTPASDPALIADLVANRVLYTRPEIQAIVHSHSPAVIPFGVV